MIDSLLIEVSGVPAPKGSYRAITRGRFATLVPSGSDERRASLRSWNLEVRDAVQRAFTRNQYYGTTPMFVGVPLRVSITFWMPRPASHWGKEKLRPSAPLYPAKKPDIDKLARATLDALQEALLFDDDSRVVTLDLSKLWAAPRPGASIDVEALQLTRQTSLPRDRPREALVSHDADASEPQTQTI